MTKDVVVKVKGLQTAAGVNDDMEIITRGTYYKKDENHYIFYNEVLETGNQVVRNLIKIGANQVEVSKKGGINAQMLFQTGKKNFSVYGTPYGTVEIGIATDSIEISEEDDEIAVNLFYELDMNSEHVSDSAVHMIISSL